MFASKAQLVLAVFSVAAVVHAQSTTDSAAPPISSGDISPCILTCVTQAGAATGCSITDACVCTSTAFQQASLECLQTTCTDAEVQAATALQAQQCGASGAGNSTATGSATTEASNSTSAASTTAPVTSASVTTTRATTTPATNTAPHTTTGTTSAPATTSSGAAMGLTQTWGMLGAMVAGILGLVI